MTTLSEETIKKIEAYREILNKGKFCNGAEVTATYNEVFGAHLNSTNCAKCIRDRVMQMVRELDKIRQKSGGENNG